MKAEQITIKATPKSLSLLRQIAALSNDKQYKILERVLEKDLELWKKKFGYQ